MARSVTIAKHDQRKRLVLPHDFISEAPYGEYIIRVGKGRLSIVAIPAPQNQADVQGDTGPGTEVEGGNGR